MEKAGVKLAAEGADAFSSDMRKAGESVGDFGREAEKSGGLLAGLGKAAGGVASAIGGLAVGGIAAGGAALAGAAAAGLNFNNAMEQTTARINAFTKDGAKTAEILEMIKDRAASTPFAFEEMSNAAAALMPAAKGSGVALEELIAQAEILAASNPAEGLEGAAFALKEALSGDYTSIIERFNLPRQRLNELKEQGVPALQAVQTAMQELGLDSDLVSNLANTASGRWSTFTDTLTNLAAVATRPIFEAFSSSLGGINSALEANGPALEAFATMLGEQIGVGVAAAVEWFGQLLTAIQTFGESWGIAGEYTSGFLEQFGAVIDLMTGAEGTFQAIGAAVQGALAPLGEILASIGSAFMDAGPFSTEFAEALSQLGPSAQIAGAALQAVPEIVGAIVSVFTDTGAVTAWGGAFQQAQETVSSVMTAVQGVISSALGIIAAFWAENGASITATATTAWTQIGTIVQGALQIIQTVVTAALSVVNAFMQAHGDTILAILTNTWQAISAAVTGALALIQGIVQAALAVMQGDFSGAWAAIQSASATFVSSLLTIIQAGFSSAVAAATAVLETLIAGVAAILEKVVGAVTGAAPDFAGAAMEVGQAIIDGIAGAISRGAGAIASAARDAAEAALDAAKRALGISSPSKEFAEVGENTVLGMAEGILGNIDVVLDALRELGLGAVDAALEAADGIRAAFSEIFQGGLLGQAGVARGREGLMRGVTDLFKATDKDAEAARKSVAKLDADITKAQADNAKLTAEQEKAVADLEAKRQASLARAGTTKDPKTREAELKKVADLEEKIAEARDKNAEKIAANEARIAELQAQRATAQQEADFGKFREIALQQTATRAEAARQALEQQVAQIQDPQEAKAFYEMRSKQILEIAKLEQELARSRTTEEGEFIKQRLALISEAQSKEFAAYGQEQQIASQQRRERIFALEAEAKKLGEVAGFTYEGYTGDTPGSQRFFAIAEQLEQTMGQMGTLLQSSLTAALSAGQGSVGSRVASPFVPISSSSTTINGGSANVTINGANMSVAQLAAVVQGIINSTGVSADARMRTA